MDHSYIRSIKFSKNSVVVLGIVLIVISVAIGSIFLSAQHIHCNEHRNLVNEVCVVCSTIKSNKFENLLSSSQNVTSLILIFSVLVVIFSFCLIITGSPVNLKNKLNN